jgi:CheY-like chemotaxis protein
MKKSRAFLVVADDPERLMLISTTLHRKFSNAVVETCRDSEAALEVAKNQQFDAIVTHRSLDMDELPLLEHLRAVTAVPIVVMSGSHSEDGAMASGASHFLRDDQWLLIGSVVAKILGAPAIETDAGHGA